MDILNQIKNLKYADTFKSIEKIKKGWSADEKYIIYTSNNKKLLLRISHISKVEAKKKEANIVSLIGQVCNNTPDFLDLKIYDSKVFQLYTYIEGQDASEVIRCYTKDQQFRLGVEAGNTLRKIHEIPIDKNPDFNIKEKKKIVDRIHRYKNSKYYEKKDEKAIKYIMDNLYLIDSAKVALCHGDYHLGNMIVNGDKIFIIDFNRFDYEDIYREFVPMCVFTREDSREFAIGQIQGYFNRNVPEDFWKRVKLYLAYTSLYSVLWAEPYSNEEVEGMIERKNMIYDDFNFFILEEPKWYNNNILDS